MNASLKRRIPRESDKSIAQQLDYTENSLVKDLGLRTKLVNENFISMFKNEFITDSMCVYELKITEKSSSYRLIGIDLIFEIDSTKILFLQILGSD